MTAAVPDNLPGHVKGTTLAGRRAVLIEQYGEPRWNLFWTTMANTVPFFQRPVVASTQIPMSFYLRFHDALLQEYFGGRMSGYGTLAKSVANWAFNGVYNAYMAQKTSDDFAAAMPTIWRSYYDIATLTYSVNKDLREVTVSVSGLPIVHPALEIFSMSFFRHGFEMINRRPNHMSLVERTTNPHCYTYMFIGAV